MKRLAIAAIALTGVAAIAVPAAAAPWQSINQRQATLDHRIDQGLRNHRLTRAEAAGLRAEFRRIARLEARYRTDGLSGWERNDLNRRFDVLSAKIRFERHDRQDRYGQRDDHRRERSDERRHDRRG